MPSTIVAIAAGVEVVEHLRGLDPKKGNKILCHKRLHWQLNRSLCVVLNWHVHLPIVNLAQGLYPLSNEVSSEVL